ncbi:hypothetical protein AURDEDRAFT_186961 [Auricularia subglabra TFB-10046 SS5]|nr:hypothetical protein AURDEDRAFT_186961 [Auricularia subglabra TFB-10046 SS5]
MTRLTDTYENAYTDFHGSGTPCIHKTGPAWPKRRGIEEQKLLRAARPIHYHRIEPTWGSISWAIVAALDKLQVDWNAINPLAYADAGEAALICDFVITIGVKPGSLAYDSAVTAANAVDEILRAAGFPEIQVALIESVYRRCGTGPKLMNFDPVGDSIADLRKAFTPTLGLSIAPLKSPHFEGTGGLFYRLSSEEGDKRVVLSTCAHVAHPPPLSENKTYTRKNESQKREDIVLLGTGAFKTAVQTLLGFIHRQAASVSVWEKQRKKHGGPAEGEPDTATQRRQGLTYLIATANIEIEEAQRLLAEVTEHRTAPAQRVIGHVLHCEEIEVAVGEHRFTKDWSFILMDEDMIDWEKFLGNRLYIGGTPRTAEWAALMFPQPQDRQKYQEPEDGLLQIKGVVAESEFHAPQDLDIHGMKTLLAVKNGASTGTTFGRVNGLKSITRHDTQVSEEYAILGYDTSALKNDKFSDDGDSGAAVVGRDGRIVGIITGGGGPTDAVDLTYVTPYFWLEQRIKERFPGCFLYPVVVEQ